MGIPRGIRDNNPGNLKITDIKWQGKVSPSTDPVFEQFTSPEWGIRALAKCILTDCKEGLNTVHKIIDKYAPSSENNTIAYERSVAEHLKVGVDDVLDADDYETMYALVSAIILHENGSIPYSDSVINKGITLAGVYNVPAKPISQEPETHVSVISGTIASVTAAGGCVQTLSPAIPLMQDIIHAAPWIIAVTLGIAAAYFAYLAYKKNKTGI